ncbi:MAG: aryl-sulfate sulfotransferase [Bacteroidetes bacterium]|nr:aryl-sulfate sulfotransferase [Bacteroidota bacterium]
MRKLFSMTLLVLAFHATNAQQFNGYTLYSAMNGSTATLMDTFQNTFKTWTSLPAQTGYSSYLEPGGILTRSAKATGVSFTGGPICGKVQKHDYAGNLIWDYTYSTTNYCTHHDICPMPNGNVLVIAYERKTATEVTAVGGNSAIEMWPDKIVEIQPTGATTGNVVWEWHAWDHLMQSVDAAKPNYVPAAQMIDHPESLNINYKQAKDWMHMNGVDYNPILDQVAFSSHNLNEWYIIDHSTTTAEAATHLGGNSGRGGDILYRWGNPVAYGGTGTAILNVTHDAHWIPEGVPNAGRLVGFNNKGVSSTASSVDQVITPVSGYTYTKTAGQAFGPTTYTSRHAVNGYSSNMGSSEQLPNGNMLVCVATSGKIYEVDAAGTQLWTKTISGSSLPQAHIYDSCYIFNTPPAIPTITSNSTVLTSSTATTYQWYLDGVLIVGANSQTYTPTAGGIYVVRITDANGCVYRYSAGTKFTYIAAGLHEKDLSARIEVYPNPTNGKLNIMDNGQLGKNFTVSVYDMYGRLLMNFSNQNQLDVSSLANGMYTLLIHAENGMATKKINLTK